MKIYNFDYKKIEDLINDGDCINVDKCSKFGNLYVYDDKLIKINRLICSIFQSSLNSEMVMRKLLSLKLKSHIIDMKQIEYLVSHQPYISLTKLPLGIVKVNSFPVGIMLYYHQGYDDLEYFNECSISEMIYVLKTILEEIKELDDNNIFQMDLHLNNILYNGLKPEIIDLDGMYLHYQKRYASDLRHMYLKYAYLIYDYLTRNIKGDSILDNMDYINITRVSSYDKCKKLVKKIESMV